MISKLLLLLLAVRPGLAIVVRIDNPGGGITIHSRQGLSAVQWESSSTGRSADGRPCESKRLPGAVYIRCTADGGGVTNLTVTVPHTAHVIASTAAGAIAVDGLIAICELQTTTGALRISTSWSLAKLRMISVNAPLATRTPKVSGVRFVSRKIDGDWFLSNSRAGIQVRDPGMLGDAWMRPWEETFSEIGILAYKPEEVVLSEIPPPADSWVRTHSEALPLLDDLWALLAKGRRNAAEKPPPAVAGPASGPPAAGLKFQADVRMVTMAVPVYDQSGRPVPGLGPEDFEVVEDQSPQRIDFVTAGETPFNLILLLDLSKSAYLSRQLVERAARDFIKIAQPRDRIAIHVISNGLFHMVSPLTEDRQQLLSAIETMPGVSGGSPIYDCLLLSSVQEPVYRLGELSALVVVTDGMDNQLELPGRGSNIQFKSLRDAALEWPVPVYTLLTPYESPALQKRGAANMRTLSEASGGRFFEVLSMDDLGPVYARVAADLRGFYTLGYYPSNQDFDGKWRSIGVRVKRPGLTVRTRPGYYAR